MSLIHALILGIIQGITEFFPVSSSAHLSLIKLALGIQDHSPLFDLACHLGTLFALVWFLKHSLFYLFSKQGRSQFLYLFLSLLPLIPSYLAFKPFLSLFSDPHFLGIFLMGTAGILTLGQRARIKHKRSKRSDALVIGVAQALALFPGISRSASTIASAQILGWECKESIRFSFLLSIPTILGGSLIEMQKLWKSGTTPLLFNANCLLGFLSSFIVGIGVIRFAIPYLEKGNFKPFVWYCFLLGAGAFYYTIIR